MDNTKKPLIFVFSGQVIHWERIAQDLYNNEPIFKKWFLKIDSIMHEYYNYSIIEKVLKMTPEQRYNDTNVIINQSFLFMYQVALYKLYEYYGIHPDILMSHSLGEFSAAYCSGMIDLRAAIRIIHNRNYIIKDVGETLMVINISENEYKNKYLKNFPNFEISCINSHKSIVIAGIETELIEFSKILKKNNISSFMTGSIVAIHCKRFLKFTDSIVDYKFDCKQPKIPIISCITGQLFGGSFLFNSEYNLKTTIEPVNFNLAMINVFKYIEDNKLGQSPITVEIVPQALLARDIKDIIENLNSSYFKKEEMIKNVFTFTRLNQYKQFCSSLKKIYMLQFNITQSNTNNYSHVSKSNSLRNSDELVKSKILNYISKQFDFDSNILEISLGELGAESLFLVGLRKLIDEEYGDNILTVSQLRELKIKNIIKEVIDASNNKNNKTKLILDLDYWKKEIKLDQSIVANYNTINNPKLINNVNILLTGGSGYLGTYMIYDYCKSSKVKKIYCLIRNKKSKKEALNTLIENLKTHQLYSLLNQSELNKIEPVLGDLAKPNFNLSNQDYDHLSNTIDLVVNSAANVDLSSNYIENKEVNVIGLMEVVKFSLNKNFKKILTFSTIAIYLNNEFEINQFNDNYLIPLDKLNNLSGYAQSKVIGEHLLNQVSDKFKMDIINIRPPFIYANPNTGSGNENDLLQLILQCSFALKLYPNLGKNYNLFQVPITWLSYNIINSFSFNQKLWCNNFKSYNLIGSRQSIETFFGYLENRYPMKMIDYEEWIKLVQESKEMCCIRLKTFHNLNFVKNIYLSNTIKMTKDTVDLITKDWTITDEMIYKNINFTFKLKQSKL